jgi:DNA-binding PadR family transcriptional regulator
VREGPRRGEPWGFRRRFFEVGEVRLALLSLLEDGPKHGYELMKELESRSGGLYKSSPGSVYPNLQLLEDEGLIKAEQAGDGRRAYRITDAGLALLKDNEEGVDRIWNRASSWGDWSDALTPEAMETWGPVMRVAQAAFKAAAGGDAERVDKLRDVLKRTAEEIEQIAKGKR